MTSSELNYNPSNITLTLNRNLTTKHFRSSRRPKIKSYVFRKTVRLSSLIFLECYFINRYLSLRSLKKLMYEITFCSIK